MDNSKLSFPKFKKAIFQFFKHPKYLSTKSFIQCFSSFLGHGPLFSNLFLMEPNLMLHEFFAQSTKKDHTNRKTNKTKL